MTWAKSFIRIFSVVMIVAVGAQAQVTPTPFAAFLGSGSPVMWSPWTSASGQGALQNTPPAIGLYCQANPPLGPWTPCVPGGGSGTGTVTDVSGTTSGGFSVSTTNSTTTPVISVAASDDWIQIPAGQYLIGDGASIMRGHGLAGAQLANGGLTGNPLWQLSQGPWGTGSVYYNDGVDSSTTTQMLARYTTGNSTYGVTVPSPQSLCQAASSSSKHAYFFINLDAAYNDTNNGVNQATSISNLQTLISNAQANGCRVVLMPSIVIDGPTLPSTGTTAGRDQLLAVHAAARNGTLGVLGPNLIVLNSDTWLPNQADAVLYQGDHLHPSLAGDQLLGQNLTGAMISRSSSIPSPAGFINTPLTVPSIVVNAGAMANGITINTNSATLPGLQINESVAGGPLAFTISNSVAADYTQFGMIGTGRQYNVGVGNATETGNNVANKWYIFDKTINAVRFSIDSSGNFDLKAGNSVTTGTYSAHQFITTGSAPTIANGAGAGTLPGTPTVSGNNMDGIITLIIGTAPVASSVLATITFNGVLTVAPNHCTLQPMNSDSSINFSTIFTSVPSSTSWTINTGTIPPASSVTITYGFSCR